METKAKTEKFGINTFSDEEMKKRLAKGVYEEYKKSIEDGRPLSLSIADEIAEAMKEWAIEKGATHYTHWFQPMTGATAEKHDAFLAPKGEKVIMEFSGKELRKGESDASSFPSGGLRATFEARGYTAWDPSAKVFVRDGSLYIPSVFLSYGGEALDKKTPLLRSMEAIDRQAVRVLRLFGNENVKKVYTTVGAEQEYFLIDKKAFERREDLITCKRTLFGASAPKGQELDDHYFGKIKHRVWDYMAEVDEKLWELGVYAKTKHNEVAPAQHELACVYTASNVAVDQNQLVMSILKTIADMRGMVCLLHEKPFDGINGSGKHNNWSIATDTGVNLLEPGATPAENAQFLLFLTAVISAVDDYADLLRISVASAGNDHRLGANEAPPAIVSMFIGEELEEILNSIETGKDYKGRELVEIDFGAKILPHLPKDKTDRNRTSPFAFTGNKFEFRMVGSNASIAGANIVLNTIVADKLQIFADELEKSKDFAGDLIKLIRREIKAHKRIIFNGNNYSDEWIKEAKKRGLLNLKTTVDALPHYISEKNIALFERQKVFTRSEVKCRYDIKLESYLKTIAIEAKTMLRMAKREIIPAVIAFLKDLGKELDLKRKLALGAAESLEVSLYRKVSAYGDKLYTAVDKLEYDFSEAEKIADECERAVRYKDVILEDMKSVRESADELEKIVGKGYW
ncbi:MAG: glutamine synthetase III, partial [Clostridia bacterium]|nr:glutamine synthetase III [Clostridia bacterium]